MARTYLAAAALLLALIAAMPAAAAARTDTPYAAQQPPPAPGPTPTLYPYPTPTPAAPPPADSAIAWRESAAEGLWWAGRLRRGVQLPAEGADWFTWDPVLKRKPNRGWRRWGTDRLVRRLLRVLAEFRLANPEAPRVGIGDLSRRHGGDFGPRFGGLGHASHQNGLDADVYYPRTDRLERRAYRPGQVDRALAQDLVDRFVDAGARVVYTGPSLGLRGPRRIVVPLVHHDDHLHVRLSR